MYSSSFVFSIYFQLRDFEIKGKEEKLKLFSTFQFTVLGMLTPLTSLITLHFLPLL